MAQNISAASWGYEHYDVHLSVSGFCQVALEIAQERLDPQARVLADVADKAGS